MSVRNAARATVVRIGLGALVVGALVTLGPSRSGVDFTANRITYMISGTIRDGLNGLAGVIVTAGGQSASTDSGGAYQIAGAYAWRGEKVRAFEWLERARVQHDGGLTLIQIDPLLRSLRNDPRVFYMHQTNLIDDRLIGTAWIVIRP